MLMSLFMPCSAHGGADYQMHHGSLHYMFEAVLPFLQVSKMLFTLNHLIYVVSYT